MTHADTKGIFWPLVSPKSMWILQKEFLNRVLNCSWISIWYFMYCPVVKISSAFSIRRQGKQREKGASVSLKILNSIRSLHIVSECMWIMPWAISGLCSPILLNSSANSLPALIAKICPKSVPKMQGQIFKLPSKSQTLSSSRHFNS